MVGHLELNPRARPSAVDEETVEELLAVARLVHRVDPPVTDLGLAPVDELAAVGLAVDHALEGLAVIVRQAPLRVRLHFELAEALRTEPCCLVEQEFELWVEGLHLLGENELARVGLVVDAGARRLAGTAARRVARVHGPLPGECCQAAGGGGGGSQARTEPMTITR